MKCWLPVTREQLPATSYQLPVTDHRVLWEYDQGLGFAADDSIEGARPPETMVEVTNNEIRCLSTLIFDIVTITISDKFE